MDEYMPWALSWYGPTARCNVYEFGCWKSKRFRRQKFRKNKR